MPLRNDWGVGKARAVAARRVKRTGVYIMVDER
jgi:hypothetical protein